MRFGPPLPIESGERGPAPAQHRVRDGLARFYAHHDFGVLLDLANLPEFDIVAEGRHQRWLQAGAAQIARGESRKNKKQRSAQNDGTKRDGQRGEAQRAAQAALLGGLPAERRSERAVRAAAHFHSEESGDAEKQKNEKENKEGSVHREDGGSQHGGEGQHGEKQSVAIAGGAVQSHQHHVHQKMHGAEQRRKQRRVRGSSHESARKKENVQRKKSEIADDQPGGPGVRQLRRLAAPQAKAFVDHGQRGKHAREQVKLAGAYQSSQRGKDQEKHRRAKKTLGGERGQLCGKCGGGGHELKVHGSTQSGERREGLRAAVQRITRQARAESAAGAASAARAALRVRLEMASEEGDVMSESGIVFAPGRRGSCATRMRKGCNVMAWCVTAWRAAGKGSNSSGPFVLEGGRIS